VCVFEPSAEPELSTGDSAPLCLTIEGQRQPRFISLLGLKQLEVRLVEEDPPASATRDLAEDSGLLEPSERGIDGGHAQADLRCRSCCGQHDATAGQVVHAQGGRGRTTESMDFLAVIVDQHADAACGFGGGSRYGGSGGSGAGTKAE
jgi:hypothetical protein